MAAVGVHRPQGKKDGARNVPASPIRLGPFGPGWWADSTKTYVPSVASLDEELRRFTEYAALTPAEGALRQALNDLVVVQVQQRWPSCRTLTFGSCATGLATPASDIDVAVCRTEDDADARPSSNELWALAEQFRALGLGIEASVYAEARTPILRLFAPVDALKRLAKTATVEEGEVRSGRQMVPCDVSFVSSLSRISHTVQSQLAFLRTHRAALPLILATKTLLRMWGLNAVHTGGLSSTGVFLLVRRFLSSRGGRVDVQDSESDAEREPDAEHVDSMMSGRLLLEFWWACCSAEYTAAGFRLLDPLDEKNDVSAATSRVFEIQQLLLASSTAIYTIIGAAAAPAFGAPLGFMKQRRVLPLGVTLLSFLLEDPRSPAPPAYFPRNSHTPPPPPTPTPTLSPPPQA